MTTSSSPSKTEQGDSSHSNTSTPTEFQCPKYSCHQPSNLSQQQSFASKTWTYLNEDIVPSTFAEIQLVLLTFCIGLQDAVSFPDFHCFASNQTGNTVFLLLAAALPEFNPSMFITANIATSLGFFLGSAYLTGQLGHLIGPRRRLWLLVTNTIQTTLVFIAAAIQFGSHHTNTPGKLLLESGSIETMEAVTGTRTLVCIALLASAAGSQVVLSRSLNMTEISTAMATAAWVDLVIDKRLLSRPLKENRGRNRRIAFLVSLAMGSLVGACIYRWVGSAVAVTVSGGGKAVVGGMFLFSTGEGRERVGDVEGGGEFPSGGGGDEKRSGKGCVDGKEAEGSGSGSDSEAEMGPANGRADGKLPMKG